MKYIFGLLSVLLFAGMLSSCQTNQRHAQALSDRPFNTQADWERQGGGTAIGSALGSNNHE